MKRMTREQIAEAQRLAREWKPKAIHVAERQCEICGLGCESGASIAAPIFPNPRNIRVLVCCSTFYRRRKTMRPISAM